jgi:diaminohydroxyphosphoribosylaminopyrimidine deaminase/5-amino-6-(5-phosphoribosylamino)uracil reductase
MSVSPAADFAFMARALELARRGLTTTDPNPRVGCVIVRDGVVVGEGWHQRAGEPHAERHALAAAGPRAAGATVYLTLEPCVHHGRTPPCAPALIQAQVVRVVCAAEDPNPRVAGGGLAALRAAGIAVETGIGRPAAEALNPGFNKRMRSGLPWVRVKLAASLDGRTALASGESRWITGAPARADVHLWRARASAILTGIDTVLADDPQLNVRLADAEHAFQEPWRVIVDSRLRIPPTATTLSLSGQVLVFTRSEDRAAITALENRGAQVMTIPGVGPLPLDQVLRSLGDREINEVWVEAGARLSGALIQQGLADELIVYVAPNILGDSGRGMFALGTLSEMAQRIEWQWQDVRRVGEDLRLHLLPRLKG